MAAIRDRVQNSLIERLILRYAKPFLSNIELSSNIREGVILITNIKMKDGIFFFEAVEKLLQQLSVDVWGVGGSSMIWPHGVDIGKATVGEVTIKVPTPNPFNGEKWIISIDGVEGECQTLTSARKAELLMKSRAKALEEAEKRLRKASEQDAAPAAHSAQVSASREHDDHDTNFNILEVDDDDHNEGGLAKRIDRYFKKHLDIEFVNCHVIMRTVEDDETPEALWEATVGRMGMDLGVDEIRYPKYHYKALNQAKCSSQWGRGVPPEVNVFEEKVGLLFERININSRISKEAPRCIDLNFPNRMMHLHVVRKQWPEFDTSHSNGWDRIHVELPDEFQVGIHLDHDGIRGSLIRALHQIFDGVAQNVPNWCDWITVPPPGGWHRDGTLVEEKEPELALRAEYLHLLASTRRASKAQEPVPWWKFWSREWKVAPDCQPCVAECSPQDMFCGDAGNAQVVPIIESPEEVSVAPVKGISLSRPSVHSAFFPEPRSKPSLLMMPSLSQASSRRPRTETNFTNATSIPETYISGMHAADRPSKVSTTRFPSVSTKPAETPEERLAWFELSQCTEWIAYLRSQVKVHQDTPGDSLFERLSIMEGDCSGLPKTGLPNSDWLVVPWRRYEITLSIGTSFEVNITNKRDAASVQPGKGLKLKFLPKMAITMIRDLPAEWYCTAWMPGLAMETENISFLEVSGLAAKLYWGRRENHLQRVRLPADILSVCVLHKLRINSLPIHISPPVLRRLLPLLTEIIPVVLWPELRYFFGEWGYMPRPLAYIVKRVSINKIRLMVSSEPFMGDTRKDAEMVLTVASLDLTSANKPLYVDHNWEAWWNFDVHIGSVHISTQLENLSHPAVGVGAIGFTCSRLKKGGNHFREATGTESHDSSMQEPKSTTDIERVDSVVSNRFSDNWKSIENPSVLMEIKLMTTWLVLSPDMVLCFAKLLTIYTDECQKFMRPLMDATKSTVLALCGVRPGCIPELPKWSWPMAVFVKCTEMNPILIHLKHQLSKVVQVKTALNLTLLFREPESPPNSTRFIDAKMSPAEVSIECYDEEGSEAWEPLLEPWKFELRGSLYLPPTPRFELRLRQLEAKTLELNISSTLGWSIKTVYFAWIPIVLTLITYGIGFDGWRKLAEYKQRSSIGALNLTGSTIVANLHLLPRSITDVVLKVQSIFRARRDRRRVRDMRGRSTSEFSMTSGAAKESSSNGSLSRQDTNMSGSAEPKRRTSKTQTMTSICSMTSEACALDDRMNMKKTQSTAQAAANAATTKKFQGFSLESGKPHPLVISDTQRLWLHLLGVPKDFEKAVGGHQRRLSFGGPTATVPEGAFTRCKMKCLKMGSCFTGGSGDRKDRLRSTGLTNARSSISKDISGIRGSRGSRQSSDQSRVMNVCRHGHTAVIPTGFGGGAAFVCEVVSPAAKDRLLLLQSPIRIFNYSTFAVQLRFLNGSKQIMVADDIASGCTCAAEILGEEQPLETQFYMLPFGVPSDAESEDGSWLLPPNCFASVPPQLRLTSGSLEFRIRSPQCRHWDCESVIPDSEMKSDVMTYTLPCGNLVRIRFCTHLRFESSLGRSQGQNQKVTCWDICILPAFSLTILSPMAMEVEVCERRGTQEMVSIEPGNTQHFYKHSDVSLRMRFKGYEKWSSPIHHAQSDGQSKSSSKHRGKAKHKQHQDEHVAISAGDGVAATEVIVRRGDLCSISSPIWLCDKSTLGLKFTDKKGHEYPLAGGYHLLPSKGDTYVVMPVAVAQELGASDKELRCRMPAQYLRNSSSTLLLDGLHRAFPLSIKSKQLDITFREFHVDYTAHSMMVTVQPGLVFYTSVPLLLRYNYGTPIPLEKGTRTAIWPTAGNLKNAKSLEDMVAQFCIDEGRCEWSQPFRSGGYSAGVYSLAIASQRRKGVNLDEEIRSPASPGKGDRLSRWSFDSVEKYSGEGGIRTLLLEIAHSFAGVLSFSVTASSDELRNNSSSCELVVAETDAPEQHSGSPSRGTTREDHRSSATLNAKTPQTRSDRAQSSESVKTFPSLHSLAMKGRKARAKTSWAPVETLPAYSFTCRNKERAGIGWFQPFHKGVVTNMVNLYIVWKDDSSTICGPCEINLYSTSMYVLLRPFMGTSDEMTTVIQVRQSKQRRIIEIFDEEVVHSHFALDTIWLCSMCGNQVPQTTKAKNSNGVPEEVCLEAGHLFCPVCHAVLRLPGFEDAAPEQVESLQAGGGILATLLSAGRWISQTVLDCSLRLPSVGISLIAKRTPAKEILYTIAEGVEIAMKAPEGALVTHTYKLEVQGVRCDRLDVLAPAGSPSILVSTVVERQGSVTFESSCLDVVVVRPNVSAFGIFLKEVSIKFGQRWDVEVETTLMNELFGISDEFAKSLGPLNKYLHPNIGDRRSALGASASATVASVFEQMQQAVQDNLRPESALPRPPIVIHLDKLEASAVDAKLWVKLRLAELAFMPADVRWILNALGGWVMPSLQAANVHIAAKTQAPQRGSILEIGKSLLKSYRNEIIKVSRQLFGSTHLGKKATEAVVEGMSPPTSPDSSATGSRHKFLSDDDSNCTAVKRTRPHVSHDTNSQALAGAPWLRQPRLLLARARVVPYDHFHASVLHCLGPDILHDVLHIFRLTEEPANVLLLNANALVLCRVSQAMLAQSAHHRKVQVDKTSEAVLGRWPWEDVVRLSIASPDMLELHTVDEVGSTQELRLPCGLLKEDRSTVCGLVARFAKSDVV